MSPLLIHLIICCPSQQNESPNDQETANNSGGCKWRVKWRRQKLIYNSDDEDGEECGNGGQDGGCEGDEGEKGARECWGKLVRHGKGG